MFKCPFLVTFYQSYKSIPKFGILKNALSGCPLSIQGTSKEILRWKKGYPGFSLLHPFRTTLLVPCSTLFGVTICIIFSNISNFQLNCTGCANELYMDQLNQEFSEHEFRLLRVLNDQFMYVTIRKLSLNDSRSLHSFLDQSSAGQ